MEQQKQEPVGLQSNDAAFTITDRRAMEALAEAERRHFWHRSRNRLISDRLRALGVSPPASFVELGCGGGCVSAHLASEGFVVTGVEGHESLVELARTRAPRATFFAHDLSRGVPEALRGQTFQAAGLFDVIEHLDDPIAALELACTLVRPGGFVVGTVPALMALWSEVDTRAGHKTRYDLRSIRPVLDGVRAARVVEVGYFNRALVPMMWTQRRAVERAAPQDISANNLRVPAAPLNIALHGLLRAEHLLAPPTGRTRVPGASIWFALRT